MALEHWDWEDDTLPATDLRQARTVDGPRVVRCKYKSGNAEFQNRGLTAARPALSIEPLTHESVEQDPDAFDYQAARKRAWRNQHEPERLLARPIAGLWVKQAACRGMDPAVFFPETREAPPAVKAICEGCPVRRECADHAVEAEEKFGVWGGMTPHDRGFKHRRSIA